MKPTKQQLLNHAIELVEEMQTNCYSTGLCHACGSEQVGCEPDARNYECENCGESQVFGAEETLIMLA